MKTNQVAEQAVDRGMLKQLLDVAFECFENELTFGIALVQRRTLGGRAKTDALSANRTPRPISKQRGGG